MQLFLFGLAVLGALAFLTVGKKVTGCFRDIVIVLFAIFALYVLYVFVVLLPGVS